MCDTCGCNDKDSGYIIYKPTGIHGHYSHSHHHNPENDHNHDDHHTHHHNHDSGHTHDHNHEHGPDHYHDHKHNTTDYDGNQVKRIAVETDVLHRNNLLAERNRGYFEAKNIIAMNLVSSPGSGKTTILEKTIRNLSSQPVYVIEGDQQTTLDAQRIDSTGTPVVQVNTGNGCHLDAEMVYNAVNELNPQNHSLLLIENVGNLVCPALFNLGENYRVVMVSVTEGDDKPLKYPNMFQTSHICIINKTDLLPYVDFNMEQLQQYALRVNPDLIFMELSAKTGQGFENWIRWIQEHII